MRNKDVGVTSAENNERQGLVPRLRFPEFRDAGEWGKKPLAATCRITQGGTPDTTVAAYWGGTVQWLTPAEMGKGESKYITETVRKITNEGLANCSSELLPANSVIISTRAPIGYLAINQTPMAINQGCRGLILKLGFYTCFIFFSLENSKSKLNDLGSGNTFKELSVTSLKSFCVPFPGSKEQQKIADCLSSIDELITAQTQKIEALKMHKKSLMQKLFPVEGETVPRLRFLEFQNIPSWDVKKLGDVFDFLSTANNPRADLSPNGDAFYVHYGDLHKKHHIYLDFSKISIPRISNDLCRKAASLKNGDLILADASEDIDGVAKAVEVKGLPDDAKAVSGLHTILLRDRCDFFSPGFKGLLREISIVKRQVARLAVGTKVYAISKSALRNVLIPFTKKEEQKKIADCLSSTDELIIAHAQKLKALKTLKKGLMQCLFPSNSEGET